MHTAKIKIAIITRSLANGGAERSCGLQSVLLSDYGYQVHVVTVLDEIDFDFKGELLNLGKLKNKDNSSFGRLQRMLVLRQYLKKNNFDYIIDHRPRSASWSELLISKLVYPPKKTIYVVHSFKIEKYFPKITWIAKIIYKQAPFIVTVSDEIKAAVIKQFDYKNVVVICNPIDSKQINFLAKQEKVTGNFILAYGRIEDDVKNYSLLIAGYAKSQLPLKGVLLYIMGDGKDVVMLKRKVADLNLSDKIIFKPKITNPFPYVQAALFTTLTSKYEGFPMVIIESLALATPVIAVDCHSGPREIIANEQNGLLIENNNAVALSDAMNRFVNDAALYKNCKSNASGSVAHLSLESIAKQWQQLLSK